MTFLLLPAFTLRGALRFEALRHAKLSSSSVWLQEGRRPQDINPEHYELLNDPQFNVDVRKTWRSRSKKRGAESTSVSESSKGEKQSLYSYIESYDGIRFSDKTHRTLIFDCEGARRIAELVVNHSKRDQDSLWIDADGGFALVTKHLLDMGAICRAKILERDENLLPLVNHLRETKFKEHDVTVLHQNYLQHCTTTIHQLNYLLVPPLIEVSENIDHESAWQSSAVPFSMLATVTHTALKYLLSRRLRKSNPLSEFYMGRSEFFLLLSPHSFARVRRDSRHSRLFSDIMFQLLFDLEPLEELKGTFFLPQLNNFGLKYMQCPTDRAVLVRVQPKLELGLRSDVNLDDFNYFVHSLQHRKADRLVTKLERWLPGLGIEAIRCGHSIFTQGGQVAMDDLVSLFNQITAHEGFEHSTLPVQSEMFKSGMDKTTPIRQEGSPSEKMLDELRKTYI